MDTINNKFDARYVIRTIAAVMIVGAVSFSSASAQQATNKIDAEAKDQALQAWHEQIKKAPPPTTGCFHASYPSVIWSKVACGPAPRYRSAPRWKVVHTSKGDVIVLDTAGDGTDYVAAASSTITSSVGTFPSVKGVTSEQGINVPFGPGESDGITGKNQYTLQLNSDVSSSSTACTNFGYQSCQVWEQFVYTTNNNYDPSAPNNSGTPAQPQVFIQTWVFPSPTDYFFHGCPNNWQDATTDVNTPQCAFNSDATNVPDVAATSLATLKLSATASANGNDTVTFTDGTEAYSASEPDSTVYLSNWWSQSEFNVVGNGGGSQAKFNSGSSITVRIAVEDGGASAPTCAANSGSTGETNNLNLGGCSASGGSTPYIQFTESN